MIKQLTYFLFLFLTISHGQKLKPKTITILSDSISETSGLIAFDNLLWTHNDDKDNTLYALDTLGKIKKKVVFPNLKNNDWEEISQDKNYIYIGDFGNNFSGNRTDFRIIKIDKKTFYEKKPKTEIISFSYENQTNFKSQKTNTTNFDCEALIVQNDTIYLFTKQWRKKQSSVYALPNSAGNHIAKLQTTLNTKGLITGATFLSSSKTIVLCGYSKKAKPFLYIISGFKNNDFESVKKEKIKLKLPFHQVEAIATFDDSRLYITNEKLVIKPIINTKQQIHTVDLSILK